MEFKSEMSEEFAVFAFVIVLALLAYWSMVIFPRQRAFKKHNQYVHTMKPGDEVITYGGIIGTLISIHPDNGTAYVKVADGVELKMLTAALTRPYDAEDVALHAQVGIDPEAEAKIHSRV